MKCEFVMALLHGPEVVFLDEPTIGLDIIAKSKVRDCVLEMNRQGVTFILTTHDMGDVELLAGRVIVINSGEIAFDGSLSELRGRLGGVKRVKIRTRSPHGTIGGGQLRVVSRPSEYESVLELDDPERELDGLMRLLAAVGGVCDVTIEEPPVEEIMKVFYK
jgi:ABC-2 type transport system ATP-binding protein